MILRFLPLIAAAFLAAALPVAASAKPPHGNGHPGKGHGHQAGAFDRFQRAERQIVAALEEPAADETATDTEIEQPRALKPAKAERGRGRGRAKGKMTVFKGSVVSVDAATSTVVVRVRHRNRWARVFRGEELTFSLETARVQVADTDGDGAQGVADVAVDDRVLVKARIARGAADQGTPIAALRLIDLTSPAEEDEDEAGADELVAPAPVEPAPVETEPVPVETVPEV